jgi:hypothetical protein
MFITAALLLVPAVALYAGGPRHSDEGGGPPPGMEGGPRCPMMGDGERPGCPMMEGGPGGPWKELMEDEAFKEEMERHKEAVETITEPVKEIQEELAEELKALHEEYFPKPEEGEKPERPDRETVKEFMDKAREIADGYKSENEELLKEVSGNLFDEKMTHKANMLELEKAHKDDFVDKYWGKALKPFKHMFRRFMHKRHGCGGKDGECRGGCPGPPRDIDEE